MNSSHIWIELGCSFDFCKKRNKNEIWKKIGLRKRRKVLNTIERTSITGATIPCYIEIIVCTIAVLGGSSKSIEIDGVHQIWHWQSNYRPIHFHLSWHAMRYCFCCFSVFISHFNILYWSSNWHGQMRWWTDLVSIWILHLSNFGFCCPLWRVAIFFFFFAINTDILFH